MHRGGARNESCVRSGSANPTLKVLADNSHRAMAPFVSNAPARREPSHRDFSSSFQPQQRAAIRWRVWLAICLRLRFRVFLHYQVRTAGLSLYNHEVLCVRIAFSHRVSICLYLRFGSGDRHLNVTIGTSICLCFSKRHRLHQECFPL